MAVPLPYFPRTRIPTEKTQTSVMDIAGGVAYSSALHVAHSIWPTVTDSTQVMNLIDSFGSLLADRCVMPFRLLEAYNASIAGVTRVLGPNCFGLAFRNGSYAVNLFRQLYLSMDSGDSTALGADANGVVAMAHTILWEPVVQPLRITDAGTRTGTIMNAHATVDTYLPIMDGNWMQTPGLQYTCTSGGATTGVKWPAAIGSSNSYNTPVTECYSTIDLDVDDASEAGPWPAIIIGAVDSNGTFDDAKWSSATKTYACLRMAVEVLAVADSAVYARTRATRNGFCVYGQDANNPPPLSPCLATIPAPDQTPQSNAMSESGVVRELARHTVPGAGDLTAQIRALLPSLMRR